MTLTRAVQCDLTWTEDKASVKDLSRTAPRAETEGRAVARHGAALPSLRDRHQCDKPLRQDAATALGTMPRLCPLRQAHLIPVHGEPRHFPLNASNRRGQGQSVLARLALVAAGAFLAMILLWLLRRALA